MFSEEKITKRFGENFVKKLAALLAEEGSDVVFFLQEAYSFVSEEYDHEDIEEWLSNFSDYPSLADNDEFVHEIYNFLTKYHDSEYGTWDNIRFAFNEARNLPRWKDIVDAAEGVEPVEEDDDDDDNDDEDK